jgi:hypothetical protein
MVTIMETIWLPSRGIRRLSFVEPSEVSLAVVRHSFAEIEAKFTWEEGG